MYQTYGRYPMKKILVLVVTLAFLAVGCGGDKMSPEPAKQEGRSSGPSGRAQEPELAKAEAKPEAKAEAKPEAEGKAEEKAEAATPEVEAGTGAAETGEALWTKSCDYATKLIAASGEMKDMPEEAREKIINGLPGQCMAEMKRVSPAAADESAKCMLALKVFTNDGFAKCQPKEAPAPEVNK